MHVIVYGEVCIYLRCLVYGNRIRAVAVAFNKLAVHIYRTEHILRICSRYRNGIFAAEPVLFVKRPQPFAIADGACGVILLCGITFADEIVNSYGIVVLAALICSYINRNAHRIHGRIYRETAVRTERNFCAVHTYRPAVVGGGSPFVYLFFHIIRDTFGIGRRGKIVYKQTACCIVNASIITITVCVKVFYNFTLDIVACIAVYQIAADGDIDISPVAVIDFFIICSTEIITGITLYNKHTAVELINVTYSTVLQKTGCVFVIYIEISFILILSGRT